MKSSELREKTVDDLAQHEKDLRQELFNLRFQQATGAIENPMRIRKLKKNIARILTIITEKRELRSERNKQTTKRVGR